MTKTKKPLNDGYTLADKVPEVRVGVDKEKSRLGTVVAPGFDIKYRPGLPREVNSWALQPKDTGDQLTDAMITFILDHLKEWSLTVGQLQPWLHASNGEGSVIAEISRESLEMVDVRQLSKLTDIICRYTTSGQDEEDSKN